MSAIQEALAGVLDGFGFHGPERERISAAIANSTFGKVFDVLGFLGFEREGGSIGIESTFVEDLGFDDLDMIELVMEIESRFDVVISDDDVETLKTVGDLTRLIDKGGSQQ